MARPPSSGTKRASLSAPATGLGRSPVGTPTATSDAPVDLPNASPLMASRSEDALATLTADGWGDIGVLADPDDSHDWRVWLNVRSGEGRLWIWWRSGSTWWNPIPR
jgi:hypothetical protein